jgi:uncharacterized repeat protein (TIGR03833 family)
MMNEIKRSDIKAETKVKVVSKIDQPTGKLTEGIVKDILTKSPRHPHGIKVRLVRRTPMEKQAKWVELKKYWNEIFYLFC